MLLLPDQRQAGTTVLRRPGIVLFGDVAVMEVRGRSANPTSLISRRNRSQCCGLSRAASGRDAWSGSPCPHYLLYQHGAFGAEEGQRRPRVAAPLEHGNVAQLELLNFLERLGAVSRSSSVRQAQVHAAVEVVEEPPPVHGRGARPDSRGTRAVTGTCTA